MLKSIVKYGGVIALVIGGLGCSQSAETGAKTPEELVKKVVASDNHNMAEIIAFCAPEDQPMVAFQMHAGVGRAAAFAGEEILKKLEAIHKKYDLETMDQEWLGSMDPQDQEAMRVFLKDYYADVDLQALVADCQAVLEEMGGVQENGPTYVKVQSIKKEGNTAVATLLRADNSTRDIELKKINNNWYLTVEM